MSHSEKPNIRVEGSVKGGTLLGYQATVTVTKESGEPLVYRGQRRKWLSQAEAEMRMLVAEVDEMFGRDPTLRKVDA